MALSADDIIRIMEKAAELGILGSDNPAQTVSIPIPPLSLDDQFQSTLDAITEHPELNEIAEKKLLYRSCAYYDVLCAEEEELKKRIESEKVT